MHLASCNIPRTDPSNIYIYTHKYLEQKITKISKATIKHMKILSREDMEWSIYIMNNKVNFGLCKC